ncbi:MAG: aminotransferase class I/II-fold pyridoxal phosphate-dependent enzyme, partial [Gammaproteobacteria bacterium]|nr:aminotransferase class I/II-fold pyridoxal phosphate-dependent enzyme [Gammaproteobacteria bacterium]
HNSIIESSRLSKTKLVRYKHLDYDDLEVKIKKIKSPTKIIFTDTVFSMTGEQADLLKI